MSLGVREAREGRTLNDDIFGVPLDIPHDGIYRGSRVGYENAFIGMRPDEFGDTLPRVYEQWLEAETVIPIRIRLNLV